MVGLPARGKSFIARKIARYLTWIGVSCRVFNVSSYRRERIGAKQTNEFFDPSNLDGNRARLHMAIAALDDMVNWLNKEGYVAIYDATNITREKRDLISKRAVQESFQLVFVECIANDPSIIEKNIQDLRFSPDYQSMYFFFSFSNLLGKKTLLFKTLRKESLNMKNNINLLMVYLFISFYLPLFLRIRKKFCKIY